MANDVITMMSDMAPGRDEERYATIVKESRIPVLALAREALREDKLLLLPRALKLCLDTAARVPSCLFMAPGPRRDEYVFQTFVLWGRRVCHIAQVRLEVHGRERIDPARTYLFAANHSSPSDIPILSATMPAKAAFVANKLFSQIPVFSYWMRMSGAVFVEKQDSKAPMAAFRTMVKRLRRGRSLLLFPEGHMYQGEGLDGFQHGGVHAALMAGVPIVPVCLVGTGEVIPIGSMRISPRKRVSVEFGEPIEVAGLSRAERKDIDSLVRVRLLAMKANPPAGPAGDTGHA